MCSVKIHNIGIKSFIWAALAGLFDKVTKK